MKVGLRHLAQRGVPTWLSFRGKVQHSRGIFPLCRTSQHSLAGRASPPPLLSLSLSPLPPPPPAQAADPSKCSRLSRRWSHFFGSAAWAGDRRQRLWEDSHLATEWVSCSVSLLSQFLRGIEEAFLWSVFLNLCRPRGSAVKKRGGADVVFVGSLGESDVTKTLCPSGLRGWTQVPLAQAAWVQIPQVSV